MKQQYLYAILFLLLSPTWILAQKSEARKYSNDFLNIGVGARAFGMGNAQAAVATDVTAAYWNPAGLASTKAVFSPELGLMHASYFANIAAYNYAGFTMPVDSFGRKRFGLTLVRIGVDDIINSLNFKETDGSFNVDKLESFSASDFAAIFSYAWRPRNSQSLSFGTNAKVIYRGAGRFANAWGFGLDLSMRYEKNNFSFGLMAKDITSTFTAWTFNTETFEEEFINAGQEIPQNRIEITRPSLRLGVAYELELGRRFGVLGALDFDVFLDGERVASLATVGPASIDPHLGLEFAYSNDAGRKLLFLRGGVYNLQYLQLEKEEDNISEVFPTLGAGIALNNFFVDYALANVGDFSSKLYTHVVSIRVHIK